MVITSLENDRVKKYVRLQRKKNRDLENLYIVEGEHLVIEADKAGVIEHRLRKRNTEDEQTIQNRLHIAIGEMKQAHKYDYIVINGELEKCICDIKSVINAERYKKENMLDFVKGVLENDEKTLCQ